MNDDYSLKKKKLKSYSDCNIFEALSTVFFTTIVLHFFQIFFFKTQIIVWNSQFFFCWSF